MLIAELEEDLIKKIQKWKNGFESKGLRVNVTKTKVMKCNQGLQIGANSGKWSCGICRKSVGRNSIQFQSCKKWIHKICSGIRGRLSEGMRFQYDRCTGKSDSIE